MTIETRKLESGTGTVSYRCSVNRSSKALVFIHGAGGDSRIYLNQLMYFKERYRVIAIDLPAHGGSIAEGVPSLDDYVASLELVLEKEHAGRIITVGHSMGGGISFELYLRMKERIAGMVLISTGAMLPVSDLVFGLIDKDYASFCDFLVRFSYSKNAPEALKALALKELQSTGKDVVRNDFLICSRFDYRGVLPSVAAPALIMANRDDKMVPIENAKDLAREIRSSRLVVYDGSGHVPFLEDHARVNADIEAFLNDLT